MTTPHLFDRYPYETSVKLDNFEKFVRRQALTRFLVRYELFRQILEVKGSILECGVHQGGGLMAWAKLSAGLEPMALHRRVIGFDTFEGFPGLHAKDQETARQHDGLRPGFFAPVHDCYEELKECVADFDANRFLNQFPKVELVKGDALQTIPAYLENNPHLLVALLFLDFDLYEPTRVALKTFLPRMPKGAIVAFDEINNPHWPGETMALVESLGGSVGSVALRKFPFDPNIAYLVL
ncbi:MAG: class I SAM-dependent methyltransferase [Magnetococcales bacterium]|nr:class I SAM-dependent methyltransferase [Magnetococcales bacterium]